MAVLKTGIQLYAIRSLCAENLEKGLKTVSEIGYEGVEFAGFFGHSAEEVAGWLKKYHLEAMSAHVPATEIIDHAEATIAYHKTIGNHRIVCPFLDMKTRADVEDFADRLKAVAPKYHENGMKLYYHNHAHEFVKDGGEYLIDILADLAGKQILSLEFDVFWVYRGGEDPVAYMKKYADRMDIFHAKDGTMEAGTIAGEGNVPLPAVFETAKALGMTWAIVESEASEEREAQVEAARKDYAYIRTLV
ncbi:MAG TPA: sugar phosphate isomerase/epimerase [Firmicutes bacterium]|nr:sugar phosphate isomerase/epimerase [Bacillota bacterium]